MNFYDFEFSGIDGRSFFAEKLKGKYVLIVNTASACGYTPQYEKLQELYDLTSRDQFEIIAFPSNNFGSQEPGSNKEIALFCETKYRVSFPVMGKLDVVGDNADAFFKWLSTECSDEPKWNFHKYLIDPNGKVIQSYASSVSPIDPEITDHLVIN